MFGYTLIKNDYLKHLEESFFTTGQKIASLERRLAVAQRNDSPKDPKTGRFVKKKKK